MASQELPHSVLYDAGVYLSAATFLAGITWGIMTSLYAVCMHSLIRNSVFRANAMRMTVMMATWVTIMWITASLSTLGNAIALLNAFVWEMNYPGGPEAYTASIWNKPIPVLTVASYLLTMWFADAMMLWRLVIFYQGFHWRTRGIVYSFGFLLYIGMLGTGCAMLGIIHLNETLWSAYALKVSIPCFTLSMALNVFVTACISIRLFLAKRVMEKALGRKEARASPYTSVAAMLIESAALYATWSFVFIVVYILNSPGQFIMVVTLCHIQVISPTMIIYRVSKGLGWERSTSARLTSVLTQMAFAEGRSGSHDSDTARKTRETEESQADKVSSMVFALPMGPTVRTTDISKVVGR